MSLRNFTRMDADAFEAFYLDELFNNFCHQGTIYAATPFAVREVLTQIDDVDDETAESLIGWIHCCVFAESLGLTGPCRAGVWLPDKDLVLLRRIGIVRPSVCDVLREAAGQIQSLADREFGDPSGIHALLAAMNGKPVPAPE